MKFCEVCSTNRDVFVFPFENQKLIMCKKCANLVRQDFMKQDFDSSVTHTFNEWEKILNGENI